MGHAIVVAMTGFMKIPENSARENSGGIIPDFREHFFGNFGFLDVEAF